MRDSIHRYFRTGTIRWISYPGIPALETFEKLGADDFSDMVEVCQIHDGEGRAKARRVLAQSGLRVCYGAQSRLPGPGLNLNAVGEDERKKVEQTLLEVVDEAEYLGARGIAFLAGKWDKGAKEEAYQQLLKTTRAMYSYAVEENMNAELEISDYDMDKMALIGPASPAARFAADVRLSHSNFGLLVDLSHFSTTYEDSRFVIRCLCPHLTHFHIGNAMAKQGAGGYGDQHPRFGFPESANGVEELKDFFQVLWEKGFFDPAHPYVLPFEVKPWKNERPGLVVANTKRCTHRTWSMLED